ncbi:MAG: hypothetical protein GX442_24350 [Candidatus Riflebacteria bacterium]|nr:hypothetical protein [Candidatus Riflebacteria bacterium]
MVAVGVALAGFLGLWFGSRALATLRWGCAEAVVWSTTMTCRRCGLPAGLEEAVTARARPFADRVSSGARSITAGRAFLRGLAQPGVYGPLFGRGVLDRLAQDDSDDGDGVWTPGVGQASWSSLVARFVGMYQAGRVATGTLGALEDLVLEEREVVTTHTSGLVLRERRRVMKGSLSPEERARVLDLLRRTVSAEEPAVGAASLPVGAPAVASGAEAVPLPDPVEAVDQMIREIEAADVG